MIADWFVERAPARAATGPLAGYAKGKNLVLIQVESMQAYATADFDGVLYRGFGEQGQMI